MPALRLLLSCCSALLVLPLLGCPSVDDDDSAGDDDVGDDDVGDDDAGDDDAGDDDAGDDDAGDDDAGDDGDGDGWSADEDCDDANPEVHPGRAEACWNGRDDDCDGFIDLAATGDWYYASGADKQNFGWNSASWSLSDDFTVEFWVRRNGAPGQEVRVLRMFGAQPSADARLVVDHFTDNRIELEVVGAGNTGGHGYTAPDPVVNDGAWHHVAFGFERATNTGTAWLDGVASATWQPTSAFATQPLQLSTLVQLGEQAPMAQNVDLDNVRIWQVGRTAAEIAEAACRSLDSQTPGLVLNLTFEASFEAPDEGPFDLRWSPEKSTSGQTAARVPHPW